MTTKNRNLIIGGGVLLLLGGSLFAVEKAKQVKAIFDVMDIKPHTLRRPRVEGGKFKFDLDVMLVNNSTDDLFVSGASFATLKRISIFYNDTFLANADVNLNTVSVTGKNSLVIKNIPVEIPVVNVLHLASDLLNFTIEKIDVIGFVQALGEIYQIGAE